MQGGEWQLPLELFITLCSGANEGNGVKKGHDRVFCRSFVEVFVEVGMIWMVKIYENIDV